MSNSSSTFLGLSDDADPRDRPPTDEQKFNADLCADLKGVLKRKWALHPRSQQRAIGPSEVGHACARRLALTILGMPRINPEGDPLPAWLGTAGHAKFEDAVDHDNDQLVDAWLRDRSQPCTVVPEYRLEEGAPVINNHNPVGRWFSERRVTIRGDLSGTCDLYDTWTNTVIDLKFPGSSRMQHYRKHGPSPEYRTQAHCYGKGYANEGFAVERVAIWFIPRGGTLTQSFVWSEAYDEQVVADTLAKLDNILIALDALDIEAHPENIELVPKQPHDCMFCPFFTSLAHDTRPGACVGGRQ